MQYNSTILPSLDLEEGVHPFTAEDVLPGAPDDPSPTFMITGVLGDLVLEVEASESPDAEEEKEGSSSIPENEANDPLKPRSKLRDHTRNRLRNKLRNISRSK